MFCPICGQEQSAQETRFCSRCGFPLEGVAYLMGNNGNLPNVQTENTSKPDSKRKRGLKKGLMIFLLTFLIVPIALVLTIGMRINEPTIVILLSILFGVGGLLRMAYAMLFESNDEIADTTRRFKTPLEKVLEKKRDAKSLPDQTSIPISDYHAPTAGTWRETNDLAPHSIVENTTRQLRKDEEL
jgi:hypothetical protein